MKLDLSDDEVVKALVWYSQHKGWLPLGDDQYIVRVFFDDDDVVSATITEQEPASVVPLRAVGPDA